jgi:Ca2+-binding EF-hand superfamily protein
MLLPYAAPDGSLTRAQMEAGLRRDFAKYDTHHDGCLDANQARIINESRWQEDGSTASPLIDFKSNGCVDFDEFAATARSLFDMLDPKGTGKLDAKLLKPGIAKPPDAPPKAAAPDDQHRPPPSGN